MGNKQAKPLNVVVRQPKLIPPPAGVQSDWIKVGKAAKYDMGQNVLKSGFRFVLEEQKFNDGYRYRIQHNDEPETICLGLYKNKVQTDAILKAINPTETPRFFKITIDLHTIFDAAYRPANIFGDSPMSNSKYRKSTIDLPIRRQV